MASHENVTAANTNRRNKIPSSTYQADGACSRKRRYKSYLHDVTNQEADVPRTTKWRYGREEAEETKYTDTFNLPTVSIITNSDEGDTKTDQSCKLKHSSLENTDKKCDVEMFCDDQTEFNEEIVSTLKKSCDNTKYDLDENFSECESVDEYRSDCDMDDGEDVSFDATHQKEDELYPGADMTIFESFMLIMTFSVRHALTLTATNDLLHLIRTICPKPNNIATSLKQIWKYFDVRDEQKISHFYCSTCFKYIGSICAPDSLGVCDGCQKPFKGNIEYFLQIPFIRQIQKLFEKDGFINLLKHRFDRMHDSLYITDVYDGKVYRELSKSNGFLTNPNNISLQLNTDGVSIFKSSKVSVWPIYLTINELPPKLRFSRDMRMLCGLWFGKCKPKMSTFLQPFAEELFTAYEDGISIQTAGSSLTVHAVLLSACFDAPAKCMFQGLTQFNGEFGCGCCMEKGEVVPSGKGYARIYPFNDKQQNGHDKNRTHSQTKRNALAAEQKRCAGGKRKPVNGVLELSWALVFPHFDIIRGVSVDYMHAVLLGVVKCLMTLWFGKTFSKEPGSCHAHIEECDDRRQKIQPPDFVKRIPRSIALYGTTYKAAEYRTWLLYYLYPVMQDLLPTVYLHHALLLINSIYLLLKDAINQKDIDDAEKMLQHFCMRFPTLYMESKCTYNMHQLLHLPECVTQLGPLWCSSCFFYEDLNGDLRKLFHGSQCFDMQIANATFWLQEINLFEMRLSSPSALLLYNRLKHHRVRQPKQQQISEGVFFWGSADAFVPDGCEKEAIETFSGCNIEQIQKFYRFSLDNCVFHTKQYSRAKRRNSFTVFLRGNHVAFVEYVFLYDIFCGHALCRNIKTCKDLKKKSGALVMIPNERPDLHPKSDSLNGPRADMSFVRTVETSQSICKAVSMSDIVQKVFFTELSCQGFATPPPNKIEKE